MRRRCGAGGPWHPPSMRVFVAFASLAILAACSSTGGTDMGLDAGGTDMPRGTCEDGGSPPPGCVARDWPYCDYVCPDASVDASFDADSGTTFACGTTTCMRSSQYCLVT